MQNKKFFEEDRRLYRFGSRPSAFTIPSWFINLIQPIHEVVTVLYDPFEMRIEVKFKKKDEVNHGK